MIDNDFLTIKKLKLIFSVMENETRIQHTSLGILKKQTMKTYTSSVCLEFCNVTLSSLKKHKGKKLDFFCLYHIFDYAQVPKF